MSLPPDLHARIMLLVETPGSPSISIKRGRSNVTTTRRVMTNAIHAAVTWAVQAGVLIAASEFALSHAERPYGVDSAMHLSDSKELQSAMRSLGMSRKNSATEFTSSEFPCMPKNPLAMVQWIEHARQCITAKLLARGREALRAEGLKPAQIAKLQAEGVEGAVLRALQEKLLALGAVPKSSTVKQLGLSDVERGWIRDITTPCAGSDGASAAAPAAAASTPAKAAAARGVPGASSSLAGAGAAAKRPASSTKQASSGPKEPAGGGGSTRPQKRSKALIGIRSLDSGSAPKRAKMNTDPADKPAVRAAPSIKPSHNPRDPWCPPRHVGHNRARRSGPVPTSEQMADLDPGLVVSDDDDDDDDDDEDEQEIHTISHDNWGVNRFQPGSLADEFLATQRRGQNGGDPGGATHEMETILKRACCLFSEPGGMLGATKVPNKTLSELTTFILGARTVQERRVCES